MSSRIPPLGLELGGSCDFVADCTDTLLLLHPTNENGRDIGRDLLPLFHSIEQHLNLSVKAVEITKMIAIAVALINQLTPVEDLGYVVEEMFQIGMFRYSRRDGHIHKVTNVLELLRKIDLHTFEVKCNTCQFDCSCIETHFQHCGCNFPAVSAAVYGSELKLGSDSSVEAEERMDVDDEEMTASIDKESIPFEGCTIVQSQPNLSSVDRLLSPKCNHRRSASRIKKRTHGDALSSIFSPSSSGSPAKRGRPQVGRPPDH